MLNVLIFLAALLALVIFVAAPGVVDRMRARRRRNQRLESVRRLRY